MGLQLGATAPTNVLIGSTDATALYVGDTKVWPTDTPPPPSGGGYSDTVLGLSPNLYLRLNETSGTTAVDSSTSGWNGTYSGGYTLGVATPAGDGDLGATFTSAGSGQVSVPHEAALNLDTGAGQAWSLSFVVRPDVATAGTYPGIIGKGGSSTGWIIFRDGGNGTLGFKKLGTQVVTASGAVAVNTWSHWVLTYDGTSIRWYKDGALLTTTAFGAKTSSSTAALTLNKGDAYGDNSLDEVAVFPSTLSATDVSDLYTAYTTGSGGGGGTGSAPVASFTQSPSSGTAPLTVTFTDTSTHSPDTWAWDFGDGTTNSTNAGNLTHTYTSAGTYTPSLTASNAYGSDSATGTAITVSASGGGGGTAQPYGATPAGLDNWSLAFEDHFDGTSVDTNKWYVVDGNHDQNGVNNVASNISVANSIASLQLSDISTGAQMWTQIVDNVGNPNGYALPLGGYAEALCYFPATTEAVNWPAWWTTGYPWPDNGELDIAEVMSGGISVNYHYKDGSGTHISDNGPIQSYASWCNGWHYFGLHRNATTGTYDAYWDGTLIRSVTAHDPGVGQSLVLNVGVHSSRTKVYGPAGALQVDYVRAWEPA